MVNQNLSFEEIIKCVVVGDSGVGKTCLTCAFACNSKYELQQLVKTHQASVWAIDHYQHDKDILDRSWCDVDGCQVSIRIWDTFGYHDKDRRFAYRGADVILLCFSVMRPNTLQNVRKVWYPEIRRFSPTTPIVLCGTQADLRYMCFDDDYINMEKGLLYRNISANDIITPCVGRDVSKDIGAPYYESSVLSQYGVADVFVNAARLALIERRKIKFWNTQLRRIQRPLVQAPMKMPTPSIKPIIIAMPLLKSDISSLLNDRSECDVTFLVRNSSFEAHRICLAVASPFFKDLFSLESLAKLPAKRKKKTEHLRKQFPNRFSHSDSEYLLDSDQESMSTDTDCDSSVQGSVGDGYLSSSCSKTQSRFPLTIPYDHLAVDSIVIRCNEDSSDPTHKTLQSYIRMNDEITPEVFSVVLEYLYTGNLRGGDVDLLLIKRAARLLELLDLMQIVDNMINRMEFLNVELDQRFHFNRVRMLREIALNKDFLTDITFQVDNGVVSAHKALLMARCEVMYAMFSSDFIESTSDVIPFPGISRETFRALQEYLYTGESPCMSDVDCIALIEVANRLCLHRLVTMVEAKVVSELLCYENKTEMLHDSLILLEPAELCNATQLSRYCEHILYTNFREVMQQCQPLFFSLRKEKQELIERRRWPPVWYLKELDLFDKQAQTHTNVLTQHAVQDYNRRCGCLCFSRRGRHRLKDPVQLPI